MAAPVMPMPASSSRLETSPDLVISYPPCGRCAVHGPQSKYPLGATPVANSRFSRSISDSAGSIPDLPGPIPDSGSPVRPPIESGPGVPSPDGTLTASRRRSGGSGSPENEPVPAEQSRQRECHDDRPDRERSRPWRIGRRGGQDVLAGGRVRRRIRGRRSGRLNGITTDRQPVPSILPASQSTPAVRRGFRNESCCSR